MTPEQELYQQALLAIHDGDFSKAREMLSRLLKTDRKNIDYWLWMSTVVDSQKERIYCLREILALDPENQEAALGLRIMGEKAPELTPVVPIDQLRTKWKTSLELADELPKTSKGLRPQVILFTILGIIVIGIFTVGLILALRPKTQANTGEIVRFTITPIPTATETLTPTVTPTGPAALSLVLDVTFTPTPLYVATPHNRLEAYNTAMRSYEKGDWIKAEEYFNQVLVDEPNSADVYYHLGDVYRFQGKYSQAIDAYNKGIKIDPKFAPSYLGKGRALLEQSPAKPEEALTNLQKALELDPGLNETYLELASTSLKLNDPAGALTWLTKLPPEMANTAQVELIRAQSYLLTGEDQKALDSISKARELDRSLLPIYKVWAQALQNTGKYVQSIPPLLTVIEQTPADYEAQSMLANAYFETGQSDKAFSLLNSIIKQNSKSIEAYLLRAEIYLKQGKIDEASEDYTSALRIDYNNFDANLGKGRVLLAQTLAGAAYNAFDYTEKFAKTDTQKAVLLYWRAKALIVLNQPDAAVKKFEEALSYPGSVLPADLRADAEKEIQDLYTPTPTTAPSRTPTPGKTNLPTKTKTPTP